MPPHRLTGLLGTIEVLMGQVQAAAGDPPVLKAGDPVLLMELPVAEVAGVAPVGGPDLNTGAIVPADGGHRGPPYPVGEVSALQGGLPVGGEGHQKTSGDVAIGPQHPAPGLPHRLAPPHKVGLPQKKTHPPFLHPGPPPPVRSWAKMEESLSRRGR